MLNRRTASTDSCSTPHNRAKDRISPPRIPLNGINLGEKRLPTPNPELIQMIPWLMVSKITKMSRRAKMDAQSPSYLSQRSSQNVTNAVFVPYLDLNPDGERIQTSFIQGSLKLLFHKVEGGGMRYWTKRSPVIVS